MLNYCVRVHDRIVITSGWNERALMFFIASDVYICVYVCEHTWDERTFFDVFVVVYTSVCVYLGMPGMNGCSLMFL